MIEIVRGRERRFELFIVAETKMESLDLGFEIANLIDRLVQLRNAIGHLSRERELFLQRSLRAFVARIDH